MIIKLNVARLIRDWQCRILGPEGVDLQIRKELAQKLAKAIIDEDLIQIDTEKDPFTNALTARAQLKIIQE